MLASPVALSAPCWLYQPVTQTHVGYVGVASAMDASGGSAVAHSRRSALYQAQRALTESEKPEDYTDQQLLEDVSIPIAGSEYFFAQDYEAKGAVFSYLANRPDANAQCSPVRCDMAACEPRWLCEQSHQNDGTEVLGVGEWKISDRQQWLDAVRSASETAAYWGLTDVSTDYRLLRVNAAKQFYSFVNYELSVTSAGQKLPPITLTKSCMDGEKLYQRWVFAGDRGRLKPGGNGGVTGASEVAGYTAQGTLQSVIDLAIRRAYAALAENKNVNVKTMQNITSGTDVNAFTLEAVQLSSRERLSANILELSVMPRVGKPYVVKVTLQETVTE